ncbi:MAG TPA: anti-sigma factor, partial [Intrasporangium sp.]|nr:anti-sigma factor [Intrasporangium sp.]
MSHPDDEQLASAALGLEELAPGAREHLESCDECAHTVAELRRTAALVVSSAAALRAPGAWESPPSRVWDRIAATVAGDPADVVPIAARRPDQPIRERRRVWPWAAGMAAAGLVAGLLTGRAVWDDAA